MLSVSEVGIAVYVLEEVVIAVCVVRVGTSCVFSRSGNNCRFVAEVEQNGGLGMHKKAALRASFFFK